jgi:uncharacterized protein (TIGR00730 family)
MMFDVISSVAVFCGSSEGGNPAYSQNVELLAQQLAARSMRVIYGGASVGAMGVLADAVLRRGGEVVGVLPQQLFDIEIGHTGLTEMHVVASMHERKARIVSMADAFIALPGGFGTLDELAEILTWAQLGIHQCPVGLLNTAGYFDDLLRFFDHAVSERFLRRENRDALLHAASPSDLLQQLEEWKPQNVSKWLTPDGSPLDLDAT